MSSAVLLVGLLATFGSVVLFGFALTASGRGRRSRAVEILESQVSPLINPDLREQGLQKPLADRLIVPLISGISGWARRLSPSGAIARIDRRLTLAGRPAGWDVDKVVALKIVGAFIGAFLAFLILRSSEATKAAMIGFGLLLGGMGFFAPDAIIARKASERQEEIRRTLPDVMDLLTISVEAGLGFDAALVQVMNNVPGALTQEIGRLLHEMRLGKSRADAFRALGERTEVTELNSFVLAMVQADSFGVSISSTLRAQAKELRAKRRQRAEEKAMRIPVKILFPMIFCVLPSLFVVVLGPGAIRIAESLFGING
jgi:tight adherence protein C